MIKTKEDKQIQPLLVTTEYKGVFFGYGIFDETVTRITLKNARMCIYWSSDIKGVFGLTSTGPSDTCRIGPVIPEIALQKITSVAQITAEAVAAFDKAPWSK